MSEERKSSPQSEALHEGAPELRRFARALVGPVATRTADALVQTASARIASSDRMNGEPMERAFAEIVRLNRRRVRERGRTADADAAGAEAERRDASMAAQVSAMPLDEREALLIVALAGYGYEAAARVLDLPISSVISRLMRARARLDGAKPGVTPRSGHLRVVK
ncbi:MAG TPA: sigma factor-like helix-turn-helix DNA-binding protein [Rhodoblastus sp.]|nr:sigma factor-like helix-turn-helix DNA-binding protein [Rhodoblastus sp.]